ncbi:hypothetical protein EDD27_4401 [Nonomuraea polychroma]|uniref:Uncharacterized protein n=1 Tax=Nonomuraea polychroma TaxID=46176 RepID=A0A438M807_9ACTN|nr:hypothetical protein EDD27_4401 [Nonomuraea polychroma]
MNLEDRYRRLLAWYPKEHRASHEEEMVAVLLAAATPGRDRPSARETFDLLRGAFAIRLHRAVGPVSRRHWHAAFNLAALLAPIWLLILDLGRATAYAGHALRSANNGPEMALKTLAMALPYGVIAFLAWRNSRKVAAAVAWGWTVLYAGLVASPPDLGLSPIHVVWNGSTGFASVVRFVLPACLAAVMLTFTPSSGPAPLGTRRLVGWTAVLLASVVALQIPLPAASYLPLLVLAVAAVVAVCSPVGRRAVFIVLPLMGVTLGWLRWVEEPANLPVVAALSMAVLTVTAWLARTGTTASSPANV